MISNRLHEKEYFLYSRLHKQFLQDVVFPSITVCNLNQMEASFFRYLNASGNATLTNLLINEFLNGRPENLTENEKIIIDDIKYKLEYE